MFDCGFTKENNWFRYRAAAIIVENDAGKYPFSKLMYVPTDGRPISNFKPHNDGFVDAFKGINSLLDNFVPKIREHSTVSDTKITTKTNSIVSPEIKKEIEYSIVKNGKIIEKDLTQKDFNHITTFSNNLSQFI